MCMPSRRRKSGSFNLPAAAKLPYATSSDGNSDAKITFPVVISLIDLSMAGKETTELEAEVTFSAAPKMTDLPLIPIFGPFGGNHLVIALDARYPELRKPME